MDIHVVKPGDTINSIADRYGVSVTRLIQDNGLTNPENLVTGQTIVVLYPKQTYTVKEGDTLTGIADAFGVTTMQLLRNNPYLSDREFIFPGETIVISYDTDGYVDGDGYAYAYINLDVLKKTLPYLTTLSIYNYRTIKDGYISTYYDDAEIIRTTKEYGVAPLMLLTTLSAQGEANLEVLYDMLLNAETQDRHIGIIIDMLKAKGFYGVNITMEYLSTVNLKLYENLITRVSTRLNQEGFYVFLTINPNLIIVDSEVRFEKIDYTVLGQVTSGIAFMQFNWGFNYGPPAPVSNLTGLKQFLDYATTMIPPNKTVEGLPSIGYDWELPYIVGKSRAVSLSLDSTIKLARDVGTVIQFDGFSQTPFFEYTLNTEAQTQHIVWFIDARSIDASLKMVSDYGLLGSGIWNIMDFTPQVWLMLSSRFEITKYLI